ncbi:hypothetical protein PAPYR_12146 [Paratrimastix pyriformis]|uniref:Uncharacterized protein n=1 Tax=Paratrimastix pyriformis TaxID=342808 RepID=A0ABQ8U2D3_9EUKA|nr:hypothetical protein PAPYR_12146 [Paratrimastix pyriformis]
MPLISNIFPFRRALSNTLRDSLDLNHQTFAETRVTFTHLERLGLSPVQTAVAILLVVVGFMMYYIAPSAFVYGNISLFLLMIGLAIISTIFQPYLERLMLHPIMWGSDRPPKKLVRKSLAGHRSRNRKTALMFTISLASIIFAGAMFALRASMISDNGQMGLGSDIVITAPPSTTPRGGRHAGLAGGRAGPGQGEPHHGVHPFTTFPLTSHRFFTAPGSPTWPPRMPRLIDHRPPVFHGARQTVTGVESHFLYDTFNQRARLQRTALSPGVPGAFTAALQTVAAVYLQRVLTGPSTTFEQIIGQCVFIHQGGWELHVTLPWFRGLMDNLQQRLLHCEQKLRQFRLKAHSSSSPVRRVFSRFLPCVCARACAQHHETRERLENGLEMLQL